MPLTLRYVARSDVGLVREGNEDSGYAGPYLLAVADGMGGHAAGEVASQAAIDELVQAEHDPRDTDPLETLVGAIGAANARIRQLIVDDSSREGMGTTVTAVLWTGTALGLGHIGDSRAYLLREGELRQLTHDHTFVQSLVDEGRITLEEAGVHPARSLILKALQGQAEVDPDLELLDVENSDRLLVCSDGLTAVVSDETLEETLKTVTQLDEAADELIRLALAGGAPDNVTLVLADIVDVEVPRQPDDTAEAYLVGAAASADPVPAERHQRRGPGAALRGLLGAEEKHPTDPDEIEALRYAPQPPRGSHWARVLIALVAMILIAWAALKVANDWVRGQYYIGESSGQVAIYQGVSQEIGPIRLSELHKVSDGLPVRALPAIYRDQVADTIAADSLKDAEQVVVTLRREACRAFERTRPPVIPNQPTGQPTVDASPGATTTEPSVPPAAQSATATATSPPGVGSSEPTPDDTGGGSEDEESSPTFPGLVCEGSS